MKHDQDIRVSTAPRHRRQYSIGKKPKMKDRWAWGQFAPFISAADFEAMIGEAREKNWIN